MITQLESSSGKTATLFYNSSLCRAESGNGERRWGSDLLQEAAGVKPPWADGYPADGKIPAP